MAVSNRPDHFFQTTSSLEDNDRKLRKSANTQGDPVKFSSKLLAVGVNYFSDPNGDAVVVAEAGGTVTGLRLSDNTQQRVPKGAEAPLTSLAFYASKDTINGLTTVRILAGCWDKSIWQYTSRTSGQPVVEVFSFPAHADFVKCLLVARTPDKQDIIVSGGADGDIRFWTLDGRSLGALKPQCRAIECLVSDPMAPSDAPVVMFSTSQREIFSFFLPESSNIGLNAVQLSSPIIAHETSVYKLHFDGDGDLWTASADMTAKHLVRDQGWKPDSSLQHPDFVRDVVTHDKYGWVITACRDEEVRVWNIATGQLHHVFSGHFEEVTGLAMCGDLAISVSIDATLRRWSLAPVDLSKAVEVAKNPNLAEELPESPSDLGMLTAEEEAELRALMENEEEEVLEKMAMDDQ